MSIVKNFSLSWEDFHLHIDQMELLDTGITGLLGASGSGKSSFVKALLGLLPTPGLSWILNGEDVCQKPTEKRGLGVVFQDQNLFPHMTAKQNLLFAAEARGHRGPQFDNLFSEVVDSLALKTILERKAHVLSGGEKQRVALARAIVGQPKFLFLDEPFSALDADNREQARHLVSTVLTRFKIPALLISHDREDLKALVTSAYEIKNSQLSKRDLSSL